MYMAAVFFVLNFILLKGTNMPKLFVVLITFPAHFKMCFQFARGK